MKKLLYLFTLLFIGANYTSCTPESISDQAQEQACCGDDEEILPPPPPPPAGDNDVSGG